MPRINIAFEFYNPWSTSNSHVNQCSITMPQMVDGKMPPPFLCLASAPAAAAGYYKIGSALYSVAYSVAGSFKGECIIQAATSPSPGDGDWTDLPETRVVFNGTETTGGAGISGGFSGSVSRPVKTISISFTGDYSWCRAKLKISRGTLQSIRMDF
jgi:hypothetical protein